MPCKQHNERQQTDLLVARSVQSCMCTCAVVRTVTNAPHILQTCCAHLLAKHLFTYTRFTMLKLHYSTAEIVTKHWTENKTC